MDINKARIGMKVRHWDGTKGVVYDIHPRSNTITMQIVNCYYTTINAGHLTPQKEEAR
jgi:ribosomal protein L21E